MMDCGLRSVLHLTSSLCSLRHHGIGENFKSKELSSSARVSPHGRHDPKDVEELSNCDRYAINWSVKLSTCENQCNAVHVCREQP